MATTVLLTGATGFLGSHLARALIAAGYRVVALKRRSSPLHRLADLDLALFDAEDGVEQAFGGVDAVIHAATSYGRQGETASALFEANTAFPLRVLEAAVRRGVPLFLNAGTVLAPTLNAYALSKHQFLAWGEHLAARHPIAFVNARLEHFYGPGDDRAKFTTHVLRSCLENVPELALTEGEQLRDFIHVDDVVAAFLLLLERGATGPAREFDVGTGQAGTVRAFVETAHRLTGSITRLRFGALPYRPGEPMRSVADPRALQALGWRCRHDIGSGLQDTIDRERT